MPRSARRLAILFIATAVSGAPASHDPWIKITSANFELYTTAGERSGRDLIRHFEQVRSFFGQAFGARRPDAKPACIVAFRNEKEFEPYRPNEFASAFFQAGLSHDFIVMSGASVEHDPVAVHEFTHMMVHQDGREYPPWFNEGLAELFSNLQPMGNKILVGRDIPGRLATLQTEQWLPLAALLAVDHSSPFYNEKSKAGIFYAESWKLVHMLFLHPAYRPHLNALDAVLQHGDSVAALETVYHKSIQAIEADLHSYMRGGTVTVMVFDIQLPKAVETPEVEAEAGMGARLALAELLANSRGRTEQAGGAYASLAHDYPNRWEVEEGWGRFCWHERKLDDALRHYARAVELGGHDPRLFLDYGQILYYSNRLADAIDVLDKGARLYPDNDDLRIELGEAYLRRGNYGVALAQFNSVKKVGAAQAYRYFYNLALAEYRLGKTTEAHTHAAKARTFAHGPGQTVPLDSLERALETPSVRADFSGTERTAVDSAGAPRMVHRGPDPESGQPHTQPAAALPSVEGVFEHLECGKSARLHVRAEGKILIFVIADPLSVTIRSGNGAPVDLQCGPQKPPRPIRIEYQASSGQPDNAGLVRALEFK
ncbi:MAG: tetratricopeptide repeat protein [Bryobacteraceae bacterium]